jgi:predicted transcriptional regulator
MELVSVIRHKVLTEGVPIRDVARQLGLSRNTIRRYVRAKVVPVPRPRSPPRAVTAGLGGYHFRRDRRGPGTHPRDGEWARRL